MPGQIFGEWVRSQRAALLLTQEELSARTGVSVRTIQNLEAGTIGTPRPATRRQLLAVLGPMDEIPEPASRPRAPTPAQLPRDAAWFTGREAELERLLAMVSDPAPASTVAIGAIDGMAGVGKTALAVRAAHRMIDRFPDGQLFIDLHGFTGTVAPVEPAWALERLLRVLGVPGGQIPRDMDDRAALWRSILSGRRMLIVLDNAATESQVVPLLPGTAGCPVLVTSRHRLPGLEATSRVSLDPLPAVDAIGLFLDAAGQRGLADECHELVPELVELCGRLPLAIRIAAGRLASHLTWRPSDLVERLRDHKTRLAELADVGSGTRSVAAALELSYQQLPVGEQRMYRRLGLHPGPTIEAYAAAALSDTGITEARRMLDQLYHAHLLLEPAPGRYLFHDLIRAHAQHVTATLETGSDRREALTRLLDHYRHTAAVAMDTAHAYERERRPAVPPADTPTPQLPDPTQASAWLEAELPNVLATALHAAQHGWHTHAWHLSATLHRHLSARGHYRDAESLHHQTLVATRNHGDRTGELHALLGFADIQLRQGRYEYAADQFHCSLKLARTTASHASEAYALCGLGDAYRRLGRYRPAIDCLERALAAARATGSRSSELRALGTLGDIHLRQSRYDQAAGHFGKMLEIARATGNRTGEMNALGALGHVHRPWGRYDQAADYFGRALAIARSTGDRIGEASALHGLGHTHRLQGRYEQAAEHFQQVLDIARMTGNRTGELNALAGLGNVRRLQGRYAPAADHYRRLLDSAREAGERNGQFEAYQGMGRLQQALGNPQDALTQHQRALALATDLRHDADGARAHAGLAVAFRALHQLDDAGRHWRHALDILARLGIDRTEEDGVTAAALRAHLASGG